MNTATISVSFINEFPDGRGADGYGRFLEELQSVSLRGDKTPLFTTDAKGLFKAFLKALPKEARPHYKCNSCRKFVDEFGGMVTISKNGFTTPAIWLPDNVPQFFRKAVEKLYKRVSKAGVTGVFIASESVLGNPISNGWYHMHVILKKGNVFKSRTMNASQKMAEYEQNFVLLRGSLPLYRDGHIIRDALRILEGNHVSRAEKVIGMAKWLHNLDQNLTGWGERLHNGLWLAVATAPAGFCHFKNTMLGTLLDDLELNNRKEGMSLDRIAQRFNEKMNPLRYQRPQVAPTQGNIDQAERTIARLGIQRSLERRFARLDEIQTIWEPARRNRHHGNIGVFGHLEPKGKTSRELEMPPIAMTWVKFLNTVLPHARHIELFSGSHYQNFVGLLTATHADAPPILQWDKEGNRNPVSWYLYSGGSPPEKWGLIPGYHKVTGICYRPSMWNGERTNQNKGAVFILEGARDTSCNSLCLFPEILKDELRSIRSTIEAYSKSKSPTGEDDSSACGIIFQDVDNNRPISIRVKTDMGVASYNLDRWD